MNKVLLFFWTTSVFFLSCTGTSPIKEEKNVDGLKLNLNVGCELYEADSSYTMPVFTKAVFYYGDMHCGSCLDNISFLAKEEKELNKKGYVVLISGYSKDFFESFKFFAENGRLDLPKVPILLDVKDSIRKVNTFLDNSENTLFVIDSAYTIKASLSFDNLKEYGIQGL